MTRASGSLVRLIDSQKTPQYVRQSSHATDARRLVFPHRADVHRRRRVDAADQSDAGHGRHDGRGDLFQLAFRALDVAAAANSPPAPEQIGAGDTLVVEVEVASPHRCTALVITDAIRRLDASSGKKRSSPANGKLPDGDVQGVVALPHVTPGRTARGQYRLRSTSAAV